MKINQLNFLRRVSSDSGKQFKLLESLPPQLTVEQELELTQRIEKKRTPTDIEKLVLSNMHEAFLYAKKICRAQIQDAEIFSVCYKALTRMAKRFNPGGLRFFVYCKVAIRGEINNYWESLSVVRNGTTIPADSLNGESDEWLTEAETRIPRTGAINTHIEPHTDPETDTLEQKEDIALIYKTMGRVLSEQEQMVMNLVYVTGWNFQEIARELDITRSMVQKIHQQALKNIRFALVKDERLLNRPVNSGI